MRVSTVLRSLMSYSKCSRDRTFFSSWRIWRYAKGTPGERKHLAWREQSRMRTETERQPGNGASRELQRARLVFGQASFDGPQHDLCARSKAKLVQDVVDVSLNGDLATTSDSAISRLDFPCAISDTTSRSRTVSLPFACLAARSGVSGRTYDSRPIVFPRNCPRACSSGRSAARITR